MEKTRDMTATSFVVWGEYTLLHRHRKLGKILPPGGHIEANETPDAAAVREVKEETGLDVILLSAHEAIPPAPIPALTTPMAVLLEDIGEGHQHVDLLYLAVVADGPERIASHDVEPPEVEGFFWFHRSELESEDLLPDVRYYGLQAIAQVAERIAASSEYIAKRNDAWIRSLS